MLLPHYKDMFVRYSALIQEKGFKFLTDADDFLDLDAGGVDLFGELSDSLVWVLVGKGVHVYSHT